MAKETKTDNKATGYIKIFRSLKTHWLWNDGMKLKWWIDILLSANYTDQKILLKGTLIECKRGQSVKSLETWAKDWRTTKKTVSTFFKLLQKDGMILTENVKITTRITICNYDSYNNSVNEAYHAQETESKRSLPPNNKDNKVNKDDDETQEPKIEGFRSIESLKLIILSDTNYVALITQNGIEENKIPGWLDAFNRFLTMRNNTLKQESDYRMHFPRWIVRIPKHRTMNPEDYTPMPQSIEEPTQKAGQLKSADEIMKARQRQ